MQFPEADPKRRLFCPLYVGFVMEEMNCNERKARTMIGRWLKDTKQNHEAVCTWLEEASRKKVAVLEEFIGGCIREAKGSDERIPADWDTKPIINMETPDRNWELACHSFARQIGVSTFNAWFMEAQMSYDGKYILEVPRQFNANHIAANYQRDLQEKLGAPFYLCVRKEPPVPVSRETMRPE